LSKEALFIDGIPASVPETVAAICRSRLLSAVGELATQIDSPELLIRVGNEAGFRGKLRGPAKKDSDEQRSSQYAPREPFFTFKQLVLPEEVTTELVAAIEVLQVEELVFDQWGLRAIEPFPRTALNFHGPPGTGKTMAAHALAHRLGCGILVASYAEIESKFHGDGPKNVKALFQAAEKEDALLFIDEADSLLSRRLTNVTQGSEQAINSMRSQLLICLEQFHGVVVFSTNLVQNYDKAFETRVRHVAFPMPDSDGRRRIWIQHLVPALPLDSDVDPAELGDSLDDVCGRDIKNAVIDAAVRAATSKQTKLTKSDFVEAIERLKAARVSKAKVRQLTDAEAKHAKEAIRAELARRTSTGTTAENSVEPVSASHSIRNDDHS
jgi:ATP-dependent 26S proteasome regulatory subunit